MPLISAFFGILIYMFVEAWAALREDEINASWIALNESSEVIKIKGLEG
ncbi:hypothetical protein AGMMS50276_02360 [Synergistales bacterium]|nr:hypothetical protein AGMMS50276_02360 [Synergistales bacterium]